MHTVKGPDSEQLKELIDTYQLQLLRLCYLCLHDLHLAEDAVQETFLKAWRGWSEFRGEASAKTWLTRIAIRTCSDMQRSFWFKRMDRRITPEELPIPAEEPAEEDRVLTLAVMKLPHKLQEVILLYYYQDMNVRDIAQLLNISQPSVSNRLKRARAKLKAHLEKEDGP